MIVNVLVTILMSVYNEEKYVKAAIQSILNQTYKNFEFIIFDDASIDDTWEIIKSFDDSRIIAIKNEKNCGLTCNLNKGILMAKGKYIVRMDGDDISYPERVMKQIQFMENNPSVVVSGTAMKFFGKSNQLLKMPLKDDELRVKMLFGSVIMHPSFIIRKEVLEKYSIRYNEKLRYAQDYGILQRLCNYGEIANLSDVLVKYRVHEEQVSEAKRSQQKECADATRQKILMQMRICLNEEAIKYWSDFCIVNLHRIGIREKRVLRRICGTILERNKIMHIYNQTVLKDTLNTRLEWYLNQCKNCDVNLYKLKN